MATEKVRNVIIDTDPGIDDAMGIMMALEAHQRGQINIVAFTLARGNCSVEHGIKNISAVLSFYPECLEIPVYYGSEEGMIKEYIWTGQKFHGVDGFNGVFHDRKAEINLVHDESAALGLVNLSKKYENLFVVCFAPLTNIALAMKVDPKFAHRIKGFYAMGGNFNAVGNASISGEFNFLADPEAAYVVLNKTPSPIVLVPWEICGFDIKMPMTWRTNVLGKIDSDKVRFLNSIEAPWYSGPLYKEDWIACDQIIMAVFLDESCVTSRKTYWATVELTGEHTRGQMVIEKRIDCSESGSKELRANVDIIRTLESSKVQTILFTSFDNK